MKVIPLAVLGALVVGAAGRTAQGQCPPHAVATPAPPFASLARARTSDIRAYIRSLTFDTSAMGSARQHLTVPQGGGVTLGPYAMLAPECGAGAIAARSLSAGRILATLKVGAWAGPPLPAPLNGLRFPGRYFIWVDTSKVGGVGDYEAVVFDTAGVQVGRPFALWKHPLPPALGGRPCPLARIVAHPPGGFDDYICFTCNASWCCSEQ